jgi:NADPH:quinone reductase-like Zn-dependent oxidoreductase
MKAILQSKYGSPDDLELRDVAEPAVGDDQVLVRVRAASVHPDIWHVVTGRPYILRLMFAGVVRPRNPIPGTDMAGVVESVGRNVTKFRPGDEVFGETVEAPWSNGGAYAEYVSVRQDWLALKPGNVPFEQAAALPTSGLIALQNLRYVSELQPGKKVLVNGGGGGVGSLAIQIAKAHGAHVTAVDTTAKQRLLRSLGADEVIDFTQEDFARRGVRYDLIVDVPGNRPFSVFGPSLAPDGRYVPIGHQHFDATGHRVFGLLPHFFALIFLSRFVKQLRGPRGPVPGKPEAMATLTNLLATGKISPIIDRTYPLAETGRAIRHMVEDELQGKVIITV